MVLVVLNPARKNRLGWLLFGIGVASTVPLAARVFRQKWRAAERA